MVNQRARPAIPMIDFKPTLTLRQTKAWDALYDPEVSEVLYGGAKGGGKSVLGCYWCFTGALEVIQQHKLKPSTYPLAVGWMGRKQGVDFKDTTFKTWKRFIPADAYRIREQAQEIVILDTVSIGFGGLDHKETVNKFNSAEFAFFLVDQAEETVEDDISVLRAALRLVINGKPVPGKALWTANPARCWLKEAFIVAPRSDQRFVRALPGDNPYLPAGYVDVLKNAFRHRPELLEAYLYGSWEAFDDPNQVIRGSWVEAASQRKRWPRDPRKLVVVDVARFGDDETVIYRMKETEIEEEEIYGQADTMRTANRAFVAQREMGGCPVAVDEIGVGGGVVDRLVELGCDQVISINSAGKSADPVKYYNLRAEMWWEAAQSLAEGDVALAHDDPTLRSQLCTPTYSFRNGRILVEPKRDIKERLQRSPDRADTYIMGVNALAWIRGERPVPDGVTMRYPHLIPDDPAPEGSFAHRDKVYEEEQRRPKAGVNW